MISPYTSDKIRIMSFVSIILVLYIHSGFHDFEIGGMVLNESIQYIISDIIGRCAVPLFYCISGYLFFVKVPQGIHSIFLKIKKRIRTLVIPYFIACSFYVVLVYLIANIPYTDKFTNSPLLSIFKNQHITTILTQTYWDPPLAFQLWFLRDLILVVLFSPLWYLLIKRIKWGFTLFTFIISCCFPEVFGTYALLWFSIGGNLAMHPISTNRNFKQRIGIVCLIAYIIIGCYELYNHTSIQMEWIKSPVIAIGLMGSWTLYDRIVKSDFTLKGGTLLEKVCHFTFFIYLFHEPTINIVRKLIVVIIGKDSVGYLTSYLLSPWMFIICGVIIGNYFMKYFPKAYRICVGDR